MVNHYPDRNSLCWLRGRMLAPILLIVTHIFCDFVKLGDE